MTNKKSKIISIISMSVAVMALLFAYTVWAESGTTDSPAAPAGTNSYNLDDIYNRLNAGTAGTQSAFTEPSVAPGAGTMADLNTIMGKAPAVDDTNGAGVADVASGKTFWGLSNGEWGLQTGTASGGATYNAGVPKTGQTTSYATGDDGDLERGVAWPSPRFTDNGDGTVTDNLTGLIWLKNANCADANRTWATALTDVAQLNIDGTMNGNDCGDTSNGGSHQTDWRLPNLRELQSLIDYGQFSPALPSGHPFSAVQSFYYWSSTSGAASTSNAWYVNLFDGSVFNGNRSNGFYVWPVRAGQ